MLRGYFKIPLSKQASKLTTFFTPWGKFLYLQAQIGLDPSSDLFNDFMSVLVDNLEGLHKSVDDVLAAGQTLEELDSRMRQFFKRCKEHGVKLSTLKYKTGKGVKFRGQKINTTGESVKIKVDEDKLKRITEWPSLSLSRSSIASLGNSDLNNWLVKMCQTCEGLRKLAAQKNHFKGACSEVHDRELQEIKASLKPHAFDPKLNINIYDDAAKAGGLGLVLTQPDQQEDERESVIYFGSTGLTDTQSPN